MHDLLPILAAWSVERIANLAAAWVAHKFMSG